ncbi:hypothetical protein IWQ56_003847 [Coemansia nantahalensis]|uniref:Uncharacterized protein n=1 Tax=Coemansia nantahalensis TaxID=2789366 RepID=A0ACC1K2G7_9FUNG|nr:hypothetical protein IWQ56_003847 [Coemansia nantahalensis]KAJ2771670.1 hypothetical protein IWQ57_002104 [Coemansia nantahalensis]
MSAIESLPHDVFVQIALALGPADLITLACTNRALHRLVWCDQLWIEKIGCDFGDRGLVLDLLAEAGVDIAEHVDACADLVPWQLPDPREAGSGGSRDAGFGVQCYRARFQRVYPVSNDAHVCYARDAEAVLDQVKLALRDEQSSSDDAHAEAARRLVLVQEYFPASAECYYLWALICYMRSALRPALALLTISHGIDSGFAPAQELLATVQATVDSARGAGGAAPLLDARCSGPSSQLAAAMALAFQRLDHDRDGVLGTPELAAMVKLTNGQPVPIAAIAQMIQAFGGQMRTTSGRRCAGWDLDALTRFYVAQTIQDPDETRQDLAKLGFDPRTLRLHPARAV